MGDKGRQDPREGRHTIKQRDAGDKTLGKASTPSNKGQQEGAQWGTMGDRGQDPREGEHTIQQREARSGTMGDKGRQDPREGGHTIQQRQRRTGTMGDKSLGKADTTSNKGKEEGVQWETRPSGRRTQHPTKAKKKGYNGRQDPREGRHTIQQRATRRGTMGDKGRQDTREGRYTIQQRQKRSGTMGDKTLGKADMPSNKGKEGVQWEAGAKTLGKADTPSNTGTHVGRQWKGRGNKTLERRTHHPTKAKKKGYNGKQDRREGGHTIQHRETRRGTMGDGGRQGPRPSGRRTHHPTKAKKKKGCHGRQNSQEGGHGIQQKESRRGIMGDKGRQDPREGGHTIQQRQRRTGTMGDKSLGKADTTSNKGKEEGVQWETRPSGRRTHHPTKAKRKGYNGRQDPREGGHTIQQRQRRRGTMGDKTLGKADTPSNKGKEEGVQWETRPSGRRTHHPTKAKKKGYNGRQDRREGGHTIQHQGGHLKKALRNLKHNFFDSF